MSLLPNPSTDGELLAADWLWSVASGVAELTVPWDLRDDRPAPTERTWELLEAHEDYEVWAICWPPGTGLDMHDHGPSAGAFCVVAGDLVETVARPDGGVERRRWSPGHGSTFEPGVVHGVVNETTTMATTVHVYAPPLSDMTFYDRRSMEPHTATPNGRSTGLVSTAVSAGLS